MKLNIGSGYPKGKYLDPQWINIDDAPEGTFPEENRHLVTKMSVLSMPTDWTDKFEEVHCIHMLEHINRNLRQNVITEICRVTAPGGIAYIEVPDFRVVIQLLNFALLTNNTPLENDMTASIYGKQRYPGDQHCWGFTDKTLALLCKDSGFKTVSVQPSLKVTNDGSLQPTNLVPVSSHYKHEPIILATCIK